MLCKIQVKQNIKFFVKTIDKTNATAYNRSIKPRPDERGGNVKKGNITMKKALALVLAAAFCAACFVLTTGAAAPADEFSLLPQENGKAPVTVTGGKLTYNADGSVTLTLEDTSATIAVEYTKDGTVEEEKKINMKEDGKTVVIITHKPHEVLDISDRSVLPARTALKSSMTARTVPTSSLCWPV